MDARVKPAHDSGESGANELETALANENAALHGVFQVISPARS
jgi:hypothetical protein